MCVCVCVSVCVCVCKGASYPGDIHDLDGCQLACLNMATLEQKKDERTIIDLAEYRQPLLILAKAFDPSGII